MLEGEIIFYNGFNLLVDIVIGLVVWVFTRKIIKDHYYSKGIIDTLEAVDDGSITQDQDGYWKLPCDSGAVMSIRTTSKQYVDGPRLFAVPEAD